jgi:hypothetical protein
MPKIGSVSFFAFKYSIAIMRQAGTHHGNVSGCRATGTSRLYSAEKTNSGQKLEVSVDKHVI